MKTQPVSHAQLDKEKFYVKLGQPTPWFFVPDTGAPGGTGVLRGPTGVHKCTELQVTDPETDVFGQRVGFLLGSGPKFAQSFVHELGDYVLEITQPTGGKADDVVTTYYVTVYDHKVNPWTDADGNPKEAR